MNEKFEKAIHAAEMLSGDLTDLSAALSGIDASYVDDLVDDMGRIGAALRFLAERQKA